MPRSLSFTQRFRTLKIQILLLHLRAYIDYGIYFVMIQAYVIPANAFRIVAKLVYGVFTSWGGGGGGGGDEYPGEVAIFQRM